MFIYIINDNSISNIVVTNAIESISYYSISYPCDDVYLSDSQLPLNIGDEVLKVEDGLYKVNYNSPTMPVEPPDIGDGKDISSYNLDLKKRGRTLK